MNVEDILGFAQLKAGKFFKNISKFNLQKSLQHIIQIQQHQSD